MLGKEKVLNGSEEGTRGIIKKKKMDPESSSG